VFLVNFIPGCSACIARMDALVVQMSLVPEDDATIDLQDINREFWFPVGQREEIRSLSRCITGL
jgi:hypothetical protein